MRPPISGATRVVGVVGDPVRHSLSPAIHNAAFEASGLDWAYLAFPVPRGEGGQAVAAARVLGLAGLNVTMPHKADVAATCDDLTPDAAALGSVNTVVIGDDGKALGDSTDGPGLLAALTEEGVAVEGRRVLVLGAGGAGRAVILAVSRAGAAEVVVAARRPEAAQTAAALAQGTGRAASFAALAAEAPAADLFINATPLGMTGETLPLDVAWLRPGTAVADLIYHPAETPFLAAARERGLAASNGLGMLVHQAAGAFRLWTGLEPPVAAMRAAAEAAIAGR